MPSSPRPADGSAVKTILVVDDDDDIRSLLRATIERGTHRVIEAVDGEEALGLIARALPDLVLLDVHMPGLDGTDVCRRLKAGAAPGAVKVLLLTAATQAADRQRGLEAGADGYITKPFSPRSLLDQLGAQLAPSPS
jgi:DNA-binding response OmpR family regulator